MNSEICGFKTTNFYKLFWAKWSVSQYFYIPLPICIPKTFRVMTASNPHRHTKKRLIKTVGAHTPCSCGYIQGGELYFHIKDYQGNVYQRDGFLFLSQKYTPHIVR